MESEMDRFVWGARVRYWIPFWLVVVFTAMGSLS
jgi:hypothetical protein